MCKLATIGGRNLGDIVCGMLKFLLNVAVQRRYNWCGLKGKLRFGNLKIASVICSAYCVFLYLVSFDQPLATITPLTLKQSVYIITLSFYPIVLTPKKLWNTINKLLHRNHTQPLPTSIPQTSLPETFAAFFSDKIYKFHTLISSIPTTAPLLIFLLHLLLRTFNFSNLQQSTKSQSS